MSYSASYPARRGGHRASRAGIWTKGQGSTHKARVFEILFAFFAAILAGPATAGSLASAALAPDQLTLTFAEPVGEAEVVALDAPHRIAIDVAGGEPGSVAIVPTASVTRLRQGRIAGGALRVVLDLERPTIVTALERSEDGRSIRVTLADASVAQFVETVRSGRRSFATAFSGAATMDIARREARRYQVSVPIGAPRPGIALPTISGPANANLPLVVLDAGHGGHDPGAISADGRHHEEQVTLAIARAIRDELVASGRVRVALTRDRDEYLVLEERYGIARRLGADLVLTIHADAAENRSATGASIYTLSEVASDREAARLAARENRSNILNGIDLGGQSNDVRSILIDLTQRETMNLSADFARTLQRTGGSDIPFRTASHRFAGFVVLKAPDMPSILLETGFISNPADAERIAGAAGRSAISRGVARAVLTHFARQNDRLAGSAASGGGDRAR